MFEESTAATTKVKTGQATQPALGDLSPVIESPEDVEPKAKGIRGFIAS